MDLRSGTSLWQIGQSEPWQYPTLREEVACEVAVVGGGITGALVAHELARAGVGAIVIDKRPFGAGSTASSTGLLQYEIDTPLVDLIAKVGEVDAVHAYRRGIRAVDEIEALAGELKDRCGFSRRPSLYFASGPEDLAELRREHECRAGFGFDVHFLERDDLAARYSIRAPGAILTAGDGQIDPYRLTRRLLERGCAYGLRAYDETPVIGLERDADRRILRTPTGRITASAVVFAAGYESPGFLSEDLGTLHSSYVLASEPIASFDGWPDGCLIWETAHPYFYARQTDGRRAIVGGEDTPYSDDHARPELLEQKAERLLFRVDQLFPEIHFVPACVWAGTFGETKDGLAYIGTPLAGNREYFALGYGGNGITFAMIAARLLCDLLTGRPNEDARVFRFGR